MASAALPQHDLYSDDELNELPPNTLRALDQPTSLANSQRVQTPALHLASKLTRSCELPVQAASSDYGFDEEDVIDLDAQPVQAEHELTKKEQTTSATGENQHYNVKPYENFSMEHGTEEISHASDKFPSPIAPVPPLFDVEELQARIRELENEKLGLQLAFEGAKSNILAKAGEIAIVRANFEKATKDFELRASAMQTLHAEEAIRQRIELETARKDREKVETSNRFLEHDLAEEVEKARNLRKTLKEPSGLTLRSKSIQSETSTPQKKSKSSLYRDGFEDDEIILVSPSRSKERTKTSTPTAGSKRKRFQIENSPAQPLPLSQPEKKFVNDAARHIYIHPEPIAQRKRVLDEEKFQAIQLIMNHHADEKNERVIESFSRFWLPSAPHQPLSSLIYDELALSSYEQDVAKLVISFCNMLLRIWQKCLDEKFYSPLHDIIDWLQFILTYFPAAVSAAITPNLVCLCLMTADIIALPTAKAFKNPALHEPPSAELRRQIEPSEYLNLLQIVSFNCSANNEDLVCFWKAVAFDVILVLLHKSQPLNQIILILQLLESSVLQDSFGAIANLGPGSSKQAEIESDTIDRLTVLLFESPDLPRGASRPPYTAVEFLDLRTEVLALLKSLCLTRHGGRALASHRTAVGRLVRFIHESVLAMYAYREETHEQTITLVNESVLLLAHLVFCHRDVIDLRARLGAVPGGTQKHLVSLSRIAFSEGHSVLESGIEPEVAEAAHKMLDEHLSPEEGEAVVEVFSSARQ